MNEWKVDRIHHEWRLQGYSICYMTDGSGMFDVMAPEGFELGLVGSLAEAKKLAEEHKARRDDEAELDRVGKFIVVGVGLPIHNTKRQAQETARRLGQRTEVLEIK